MKKIGWAFSLLLLVASLLSFSGIVYAKDRYPFTNPQQQQRFHHLLQSFRCLVCQNEDLASSGSSLANDLRQQVYDMVRAGESNKNITRYMVDRYGDFVLLNPPFRARTWVLWVAPFLFLLLAFGVLYRVIKRHR